MHGLPSPLIAPTLRDDLPRYPPLIQMVRVTETQVSGPAGVTQLAGSSVLSATLYVSFTQQLRTDSLLPRDREPCLVDDVNGKGLTPGFYLGRLAGTFNSLPVYEVTVGVGKLPSSNVDPPSSPLTFSGARVYRTTNQTGVGASDTLTAIEFDNEQFDTDAYHDNVTNNSRLTIPSSAVTRYYEIGCNIALSNASATLRTFTVEITLNGSTNICHWQFQLISTDASVRHCNMKTIWRGLANDYFEVRVATSDITGLVVEALTSTEPVFWINRLGT